MTPRGGRLASPGRYECSTRQFVVRLTQTVPGQKKVDAAYDRIEAAETTLFQFEELVDSGIAALLADGGTVSSYRPVAAVEGILPGLRREATKTWRARRSCESAIGVIFERVRCA